MDKIVPAFEITLFDPTLSDAAIEMAEAGIDSILEDGIGKSIPIVSLIVGTAKTAQNIHDRNLLRQTFHFIKSFNEKTIDQKKLDEYRAKLHSNPKKGEEELGRALILLNNNVDTQKSKLLGRLYSNYVGGKISWEQFCEMSDVMSRLFISDFDLLSKIQKQEIISTNQCEGYRAERLAAIGLVRTIVTSTFISSDGNNSITKLLSATKLGNDLIKYSL